MDELPIVDLLRGGHGQPCECLDCTAAALIRAQHEALTKISELRYVEDVNEPFDDALDIADAALAKAREA